MLTDTTKSGTKRGKAVTGGLLAICLFIPAAFIVLLQLPAKI